MILISKNEIFSKFIKLVEVSNSIDIAVSWVTDGKHLDTIVDGTFNRNNHH